ncbi:hypothetical protein NQ317_008479 [Molorchus minor]|uniref:Uncharacterized protein n=1 Tax=Molorchus minor TaxID=1323400 RepID=A0ABQ9JKD6_9CUCU|nr:hypothetical protein NQ317_008479 [Molorchus minor]
MWPPSPTTPKLGLHIIYNHYNQREYPSYVIAVCILYLEINESIKQTPLKRAIFLEKLPRKVLIRRIVSSVKCLRKSERRLEGLVSRLLVAVATACVVKSYKRACKKRQAVSTYANLTVQQVLTLPPPSVY